MQSLYHQLYHKSPSYLHLKTFGCLCYPWTAYSRKNKVDPKSSPCIFICYSCNHQDFRCFDPATSKLIISRHVRFNEHEFPIAKPTTTTPPQISTIHNPFSPLLTPTFYPPFTSSTSTPNRPPTTNTPFPLPFPRKTDTHIHYQCRRPHPNTLPTLTSTLPPLLSLPEPPSPSHPTSLHPSHDHPLQEQHPRHFLQPVPYHIRSHKLPTSLLQSSLVTSHVH